MKGSYEDKMGTVFLKDYLQSALISPSMWSSTKYILIFKIWMDNCRMVFTKLVQVVWKGKGRKNGMIQEKQRSTSK